MLETVEHNNRFYGEELKTENEQLKEWLVVANKHNEELQKERDMYKGSFEEMSINYFESQKEIERLNNIIEKIRDYVYKPIDKEWGDILCIIEDGLRGSDKE